MSRPDQQRSNVALTIAEQYPITAVDAYFWLERLGDDATALEDVCVAALEAGIPLDYGLVSLWKAAQRQLEERAAEHRSGDAE